MLTSAAIKRRLRRGGGRLIRRYGLLPAGDPDGLGDDEALRGQQLPFRVMVYFADTPENLYQLRQWYQSLRVLDQAHPVGIVCLDSRTARSVRAESQLPVVCVGRIGTLEDLVSRSDVALALYVNHNIRNLHPLRFPRMLHAYLGHGESDKASSSSNQVKAYDYVLVAGEAGRERLARDLMEYDADAHVRMIGRPQLDAVGPATHPAAPGDTRPTVLYAPTWEGAQPSMSYSSVLSHGRQILDSLIRSDRYRVVYRPHPRLGANRAEFASADRRLRELVAQHPTAGHRVDTSPTWSAYTDPASVLISDVSAVASDWMATAKPILVTVPDSATAFVAAGTVLDVAPALTVAESAVVAGRVDRLLAEDDPTQRLAWVTHSLGDVTPGASTARFVDLCAELIGTRDRDLAARSTDAPGGQR